MFFLKELILSIIVLIKFGIGLITYPYKTIRSVLNLSCNNQIIILFLISYIYFILSSITRNNNKLYEVLFIANRSWIVFIFNYCITIIFFYTISILLHSKTKLIYLIKSFALSMIPTLIWFYSTLFLYILYHPGIIGGNILYGLSVLYIIFSLVLLFWRFQLLYISVRLSTGLSFFKLIYAILLFIIWYIPYSILLYYLGIFRVPFL